MFMFLSPFYRLMWRQDLTIMLRSRNITVQYYLLFKLNIAWTQDEISKECRMSYQPWTRTETGRRWKGRSKLFGVLVEIFSFLKWSLPLKSSRFSKTKSSNGQFPLVFPRVNNQLLRHRRRLIIATTDYDRRRLLPSWVEFQE